MAPVISIQISPYDNCLQLERHHSLFESFIRDLSGECGGPNKGNALKGLIFLELPLSVILTQDLEED